MKKVEKKLWDVMVESVREHATLENIPQEITLEIKTNLLFKNSSEFEKAMLFIVEKFNKEEKTNFSLGILKDELFSVIETVEDMFLYFHLQFDEINEMMNKLMEELGRK